jgi:hypothetical protein
MVIKKKKVVKKNLKSKKKVKKISTPKIKNTSKVDAKLIQNFVVMQKVLVNLSVKFDHLSNQISQLLNVFEISAKAITQKEFNPASTKDTQEIQKKIDSLLDQNKLIARGLTLMHNQPAPAQPPRPPQMQRPMIQQQRPPMQRPPMQPQMQKQTPPPQSQEKEIQNFEGYEKSLSSSTQPQGNQPPLNKKI